MNKLLIALFVALVAVGLGVNEAEAARLGGGKSSGMQRQAVTPRPVAPTQQAAPAAPASTPAAATPKRNWLGPLAGIAAGLGLGALLSHFGLGGAMADLLLIALIAFAAIFVVRLILRRTQDAPADPALKYAAAGEPARTMAPQFSTSGAAATMASAVPADFDSEGFLRVAKLNFVRLQAANDAKNIEDLREFTSTELFAEIRLQIDERGNAPQQTDVVTLDAELVEVVTENDRHIASVAFSGTIREEIGGTAAPFLETWHLVKPTAGNRGWVVAGIQQLPAASLH